MWAVVFILAFLSDILWARYVVAVTASKRFKASLAATGQASCGVIGSLLYIQDNVMVVPFLAGILIGTYFGVPVAVQEPKPGAIPETNSGTTRPGGQLDGAGGRTD